MTPRQFAIRMAREWKRSGRPIESMPKHKDPEVQKQVEEEYQRFVPRKTK